MRKWGAELPKHTFYEDNLMVYLTLPHVKKLAYMNTDLYLYTIGRAGQSVQEDMMKKRYSHQILVTERCFTSCHLDDIQSPRLKKYLKHEMFMMLGISIIFTRLNKTEESDRDLDKMWANCAEYDGKYADYYRNRSLLWFICLPGRFGQNFACTIYRLANKIVRFNQ